MRTIIHENLKENFEQIKDAFSPKVIKDFDENWVFPYELWVEDETYYYEKKEDRDNDFDFLIENLEDVNIRKSYTVTIKVKVDARTMYDAAVDAYEEIKEYGYICFVQETESKEVFELDTQYRDYISKIE